MARNAWEYGWLMSYPDGEKDAVCYRYEPWHYRYVGREMAAAIHNPGLTIREYLWANHTQVDPACRPPAAEADDAREALVLRLPRSEPDGRALRPGYRSAFPDRGGLCATRRLRRARRRSAPSPTSPSIVRSRSAWR